jgi:hypothetical protein
MRIAGMPMRTRHAGGSSSVMPGLVPGIHVLLQLGKKDVDGRDKPGHDECCGKRNFTGCIFEETQEKWRTSARPPNRPAIESTTEPIT